MIAAGLLFLFAAKNATQGRQIATLTEVVTNLRYWNGTPATRLSVSLWLILLSNLSLNLPLQLIIIRQTKHLNPFSSDLSNKVELQWLAVYEYYL